jgi:hypothetical protein
MRRLLVPLALLLVAPAVAGAAPERRLTADPTVAEVAAYGGKVVWSRSGTVGHQLRYYLVEAIPGGSRDLPVESSHVPFELDVGLDAGGSPVAVYVRCLVEGQCDVYQYDFAHRAETRVDGISGPRCSASEPSVWRGRIAFIRQNFFTAGCVDGLYVRYRSGKVKRLLRSGPGIKHLVYRPDLRGGWVAFGADLEEPANTELYLMRLRDRHFRQIVKATGQIFLYPPMQPRPPNAPIGEGFFVGTPTLLGRHVYWIRHHIPRTAFWLGRAPRKRLARKQYAPLPRSGQPAGDRIYFGDGQGLVELPLPAFSRR